MKYFDYYIIHSSFFFFIVGAALIYTAANTAVNCPLLKKYILHRLYSELMPMNLAIEVSAILLITLCALYYIYAGMTCRILS